MKTKMQFNSKKDYENLTFEIRNFRSGMHRLITNCDLICVETNELVATGTIEWILHRFGEEMGMNILNKNEKQ